MTLALRDYQLQAKTAVLAALEKGRSPLLQAPTGSGKTRTAVAVVDELLGATHWRIGMFVHRRELMRQMSGALTPAGIEHGLIMPGRDIVAGRVHVASIDTVLARLRRGDPAVRAWLSRLDVGFVDEAHHACAGGWASLARHLKRRVGMTATPFRLDGKSLGDSFDVEVRGPSIRALVEQGHLAPIEVYAPEITAKLVNLRKVAGDYAKNQMQELMDTAELTREAVRSYGRWAAGEPCVVFCTGIDHATHVASAFRAAGWRARSVDGTMTDLERDAAVLGLADGSVQVLTSCELIGEGVDIPEVACGILLRPTLSTMLMLQQVGRIMRPHPDKTAAILIDMVGNVATHGMPDAEREWSLKGGLKKRAERDVQATRGCPNCRRVHPWSSRCPGCGHSYVSVVGTARKGQPAAVKLVAGYTADQIKGLSYAQVSALAARATPFEGVEIERIRGFGAGWAQHRRIEFRERARA